MPRKLYKNLNLIFKVIQRPWLSSNICPSRKKPTNKSPSRSTIY